ncbi:hypothetical protein [Klebsiella oxytoca]|uniref:hypothetical protein n=1 Tax=Klebsiella oxytoca TaxID=571 RepID=UPI0002E05566|nr:hypothetical protein HMPREF9692_02997 [Klebsiella oxytoca 10-5248]
MTNNQLTRERLEKIKSWRETYGAGSNVMLPAEEAEELARMALAAMDSDPVAWIIHARTGDQLTTDCSYVANAEGILGLHSTPLYRNAQPAPTARMVVIPTIWKHYTAVQTAIIYEKAMTDAGIKWRSIDD